jgi:hypothetical protein
MPKHGQTIDDIILPHSPFYQGPYGRMFRNLPPHVPTFDLIEPFMDDFDFPPEKIKQARENTEAGRETILKLLASTMIDKDLDQSEDTDGDNPEIPAGYTYFGQFITHDITFDPTSSLMRFNDPNKIRNFRTPRLDLDSLYGGGPRDNPFLYDRPMSGKLLVGKNRHIKLKSIDDWRKEDVWIEGVIETGECNDEILETFTEDDLPRNSKGQALIGDMRNDENIMLSQLQLAFIKFHNAVIDWQKKDHSLEGIFAFSEAQRLVRWHYQWVILHDFLPRIVERNTLKEILGEPDCLSEPRLCYYQWRHHPFIPVEFAVAAFRFGHSMVRTQYDLNFLQKNIPIAPRLNNRHHHLMGFRNLRQYWTLQWDLFLEINGSTPQKSRLIDHQLSHRLADLPHPGERERNLALSDLLRGYKMELPSGQDVARAMGIHHKKIADKPELPLWYYILQEAKVIQKGLKLGPVGSRIVAEVVVGLLAGDPHSFFNVDPWWYPEFSSSQKNPFKSKDQKNPFILPPDQNPFMLQDILKFARVSVDKKYLTDVYGFPFSI